MSNSDDDVIFDIENEKLGEYKIKGCLKCGNKILKGDKSYCNICGSTNKRIFDNQDTTIPDDDQNDVLEDEDFVTPNSIYDPVTDVNGMPKVDDN